MIPEPLIFPAAFFGVLVLFKLAIMLWPEPKGPKSESPVEDTWKNADVSGWGHRTDDGWGRPKR